MRSNCVGSLKPGTLIRAGLVAVVSFVFAACSTAAGESAESSIIESTTSSTEMNTPATIDSQDLAGAERPVPLSEPKGLLLEDAWAWAQASGFVSFAMDGDEIPAVLAPTQRIIFTVNDDGVVTRAVAG